MSVQALLFNHLEELIDQDFKKFKWFLTIQENGQSIPKSHLENADRTDTVSKMVETYREEGALEVTVSILKNQRMNDLAERLLNAYKGMSSAAPSTNSSSGVTPAAGPSVMAQGGSTIVAPVLNSSNLQTLNISFNKKD